MGVFGNIVNSLFKLLILKAGEETRNNYLRRQGVKIGTNCKVHTVSFSTEPYLVQIGNNARITTGTIFITHDGGVTSFRGEIGGGIFGKIVLGDNVFVGSNCVILLNTTIGNNCIVGAGSVVRGHFPDNSVIMGNPAKVIMRTSVQRLIYKQHPGLVKTDGIPPEQCTILIKKHFGIE